MKSPHNGSNFSNADSEEFLERRGPNDFIVVGIGASAGGVQALKEFFEHVPQQTGIVYVVILHLSPDFDSKLTEVLQVVSKIPVSQVNSKVRVEPDHVYVVPPNQHLAMLEGEIAVSPNITGRITSFENDRLRHAVLIPCLRRSRHSGLSSQ